MTQGTGQTMSGTEKLPSEDLSPPHGQTPKSIPLMPKHYFTCKDSNNSLYFCDAFMEWYISEALLATHM